jgi:hypothetical protein
LEIKITKRRDVWERRKKDLSILDSNEMQWKSICDNVELLSTG